MVALNANDTVRYSDEGLSGVCIAASAFRPSGNESSCPARTGVDSERQRREEKARHSINFA